MTTSRVEKMLEQGGELKMLAPQPKPIQLEPREDAHIPKRLNVNKLFKKLEKLKTRIEAKPSAAPVKRYGFAG